MVHLIEVIGFSSPKSDPTFPGNGYSNKMTYNALIGSAMLEDERRSLRLSF